MTRINDINWVLGTLKILADNQYSALWTLCDDIQCNGHVIKIKDSTQWKQVIIDNGYVALDGGPITVVAENKTYEPMEYVRHLLEKEVKND